jgi:hypothetical protein
LRFFYEGDHSWAADTGLKCRDSRIDDALFFCGLSPGGRESRLNVQQQLIWPALRQIRILKTRGYLMPTTIPMAFQKRQAAQYADSNWLGQLAAAAIHTRDELQKALRSEDFRSVAIFSGIGLLTCLIAMWSGVQGVWM